MTFFNLLRVSKDYFLHFQSIDLHLSFLSICLFSIILCFRRFIFLPLSHLFKVLIGENEHSSLFQLLSHAALHRQQRQGDQEP